MSVMFFLLCFVCFFCALQKLLILNGTNVCDAAEESGRLLISQCENSCLSWFHCDCRNPEGAGGGGQVLSSQSTVGD